MNLGKYAIIAACALGAAITSAKADDPISATGQGAERILDGVSGIFNNVATGAGKGFTNVLDTVSGKKTNPQYQTAEAQPVVRHHRRRHH